MFSSTNSMSSSPLPLSSSIRLAVMPLLRSPLVEKKFVFGSKEDQVSRRLVEKSPFVTTAIMWIGSEDFVDSISQSDFESYRGGENEDNWINNEDFYCDYLLNYLSNRLAETYSQMKLTRRSGTRWRSSSERKRKCPRCTWWTSS
ncbi:hypothetical protein KSP39_PZI007422 [Platanthera zijinensis]|uniref:Uncharacterized protein n=1 Tax=Platanthera zijinensis TaxID=2320716 RepID=A0AAP0G9Q7_9ASPA